MLISKRSSCLHVAAAIALLTSPAIATEISLQAKSIFRDCSDCPEMVVIPAGTFDMGYDGGISEDRYDGPVHRVSLDYAFSLSRHEITTAEFRRFIGETGRRTPNDCRIITEEGMRNIMGLSWSNPGYGRPPMDNEPVACITWPDAKAYVNWLAQKTRQPYRLPTEAEWEYVASDRNKHTFAWGEDPDEGCVYANIYDQSGKNPLRPNKPVNCTDGFAMVSPVGSFPPNSFGIYDIIGNVWEWVEDCYVAPYGDQPADGSAYLLKDGCTVRSVRGGCWSTQTQRLRPTFRGRDEETLITQVFGLRIARDLR
ncbi:MAG: formylglycine-generating enzyme family protein [Rhodospirillaceae bacterium]